MFKVSLKDGNIIASQLAFACSKLTIETLERGVKYAQVIFSDNQDFLSLIPIQGDKFLGGFFQTSYRSYSRPLLGVTITPNLVP